MTSYHDDLFEFTREAIAANPSLRQYRRNIYEAIGNAKRNIKLKKYDRGARCIGERDPVTGRYLTSFIVYVEGGTWLSSYDRVTKMQCNYGVRPERFKMDIELNAWL